MLVFQLQLQVKLLFFYQVNEAAFGNEQVLQKGSADAGLFLLARNEFGLGRGQLPVEADLGVFYAGGADLVEILVLVEDDILVELGDLGYFFFKVVDNHQVLLRVEDLGLLCQNHLFDDIVFGKVVGFS